MPPRRVFGTVADSTHRDPRRPLHRREVRRGLLDLIVGHVDRGFDHLRGVGLARVGARAQAVLEVRQLLHDVGVRLSRKRRILRPALAVRHVAHRAAAHVRLAAVHDDAGHRRVIVGEPVADVPVVADVRERELLGAAGDALERRVRRACRRGSGGWGSGHRRLAIGQGRETVGPRRRIRSGVLGAHDATEPHDGNEGETESTDSVLHVVHFYHQSWRWCGGVRGRSRKSRPSASTSPTSAVNQPNEFVNPVRSSP